MTEPEILAPAPADPVTHPDTAAFAVGVTSHNDAATIGPVLHAVRAGLQRVFPDVTTAIVHADGGSGDGTAEVARDALGGSPELIQIRYDPGPAPEHGSTHDGLRGAAMHGIFALAQRLGVRGLAVIDATATNLAPDWVERLTGPIAAHGADFVAPYYVRHRFDGAMTNGVAYPLTRALYGKRIRYPLAGEFACSARLLTHYLGRSPWPAELARVGADVWLLNQALCGGFRVAQAFLGVRTHTTPESGAEFGGRESRVLGALFLELERHASVWQKIRGSEPVPVYGEPTTADVEPAVVDPRRALDSFRLGQKNLSEIWALILPPGSLLTLRKLAQQPDAGFRFPDDLWARTAYDFALAHRTRIMNRDHLLSAFTPLFMGWFGSFLQELHDAAPSRVEERIEQLCLRYEAEKRYLISRWRWPDRFDS